MREAVSAAFAQYESRRRAFGTVGSSDAKAESHDFFLTEHLEQDGIGCVTKWFAEQNDGR